MGLLRARDFGQHVFADRSNQKLDTDARVDRDEPGQHEKEQPKQTRHRAQRQQPARRAIEKDQCPCRKPDHHQDQRPLDKNADGKRSPENRDLP